MDAAIRKLVVRRAGARCEYCHLPQQATPFATFHLEHILSQQHVADDSPDNLALACPECNSMKGPNIATVNIGTGDIVRLFHPRRDRWEDHFEIQGPLVAGLTPLGIATARLLRMNSDERVQMRSNLIDAGVL
jgi:hypothetical protein